MAVVLMTQDFSDSGGRGGPRDKIVGPRVLDVIVDVVLSWS
ncbi:hypothetical protein [Amycolatopsis taiwanensis]|nr:hypothetical protein [Amycolatopsis taiwanensis]